MSDLLRVHVQVPLSFVEAERARVGQKGLLESIKERVERLGFRRTLLVTQDPTDNRIVTLITRPATSNPGRSDDVITIVNMEPVEEPTSSIARSPIPQIGALLGSYLSSDGPWDAGLNGEEIRTVQTALATETDPRHLTGLASTLEPWFPVSASLLRVRSAILEPGAEPLRVKGVACPAEVLEERLRAFRHYLADNSSVSDDVMRDEVKRAATEIVQRSPFLRHGAALSGFPSPISDLAWCLVRDAATRRSGPEGGRETLRIVDGALVRKVFPPTGDEGFVSPSALQLAMATMKPKIAGVVRAARVPTLFETIENDPGRSPAEKIAAMKARASLEKAQRTLERRRWAEWYARQ